MRGGARVHGVAGHARVAVVLTITAFVLLPPRVAEAAAVLTIRPVTWDMVGLDSNDPVTSGPDLFPVAARVCNTGTDAAEVDATFVWDEDPVPAVLQLDPGSPSTVSLGSLAPGACEDASFTVRVDRDASAYDVTRDYHVEATADGVATVATPAGRQLYVERLISQNRNAVNAITGPAVVYVGDEVTYVLDARTATNGYEQLEAFLTLTSAIFRVQDIEAVYSQGGTFDTQYADACGWVHDPADVDYRTCTGTEKAGGDVLTTFAVEIVGVGTTTLDGLLFDYSGSSYHYNADYGADTLTVEARPTADLRLEKQASVTEVSPGTEVTYTLTVDNPSSYATVGALTVTDTVPDGATYVSGGSDDWTCTQADDTVTCVRSGSVPAGASTSFELVMELGGAGEVVNEATVTVEEDPFGPLTGDGDPTNNTATSTVNVVAPPGTDGSGDPGAPGDPGDTPDDLDELPEVGVAVVPMLLAGVLLLLTGTGAARRRDG